MNPSAAEAGRLLVPWDQPGTTSDVLRAALEYADLGLRVVPLRARQKSPWIVGWSRHASSDPRVVAPWFRKGRPNIGIATGRGLLALDVDPRNGGRKSFSKLLYGKVKHWPKTAHARTGGHGDHYLFHVPDGWRILNRQKWRPGIDLKGDGGLIVVEPSFHPDFPYRPYVWIRHPRKVIADLPGWLFRLLVAEGALVRHATASTATEAPEVAIGPVGSRTGHPDALLGWALVRFPVAGVGTRNDTMLALATSLLGRGYETALVAAIAEAWWEHFHARGKIGTDPKEAPLEVRRCIASVLRSPGFRPAGRKTDHDAARLTVDVGEDARRRMRKMTVSLRSGRLCLQAQDRNGVTLIRKKLCDTCQESRFVESMMACVTYERGTSIDGVLRMTRDQLRSYAGAKFGVTWDNTQYERLKRKYVSRPGKPATRFELLRQVHEGGRPAGRPTGVPSEYEPTGILDLLG